MCTCEYIMHTPEWTKPILLGAVAVDNAPPLEHAAAARWAKAKLVTGDEYVRVFFYCGKFDDHKNLVVPEWSIWGLNNTSISSSRRLLRHGCGAALSLHFCIRLRVASRSIHR